MKKRTTKGCCVRYYPVFLDLKGTSCLIAGAGQVGQRKLLGLLRAEPAQILLLDTAPPDAALQAILQEPRKVTVLRFEQRSFEPSDLERLGRCALVFAATGDREGNAQVAAECARAGVPCNCVDAPERGSFIVPAVIERESITVTVSTGGGSPALARRVREELDTWLGTRFDALAELMARLRPLVLALNRETGQNTRLFRELTGSDLAEALQHRDRVACERLLRDLLPQEIHLHIRELLHDLA